jgi:hypothetical protein
MPSPSRGGAPGLIYTQQTFTSTGNSTWRKLREPLKEFSMQIKRNTTGTSNYQVLLQGTLTTSSTSPLTLITSSQNIVNQMKRSTAGQAVQFVRLRRATLGGTTAKSLSVWVAGLLGP